MFFYTFSWWDWFFLARYYGQSSLYGYSFADTITVDKHYNYINLGGGDDTLTLNAHVDRVQMGWGDDKVIVHKAADRIDLGAGNDRIELFTHTDYVNGGSGHDTLVFDGDLARHDVKLDFWGNVRIYDKLTGESTKAQSIEQFVFKDQTVDVHELRAESGPTIRVADGTGQAYVNDADPSVNVVWQRVVNEAIINSDVADGPTIAARAMAMVHTAIYDAWASFDAVALRVSADATGNNGQFEGALPATAANLTKAMSFAAYTVMQNLYPDMAQMLKDVMEKRYGFTPGDNTLAARIGVDAGRDVIAARADDGSNQANNFASTNGYRPVNSDPAHMVDMDKWTPEHVMNVDADQMFLTPHWGGVKGFSIPRGEKGNDFSKLTPKDPEAFLTKDYKGSTINMADHTLKLSAAAVIDGVSYSAGDTVKVSKAMIGTVINQKFIDQAMQVVNISANLTDKQKVIAEFWEDGGGTSFPPGTSMFLAEYVSARDNTSIAQDAKMFMALGNAQLDASIAAWNAKLEFDYVRPIRAIRSLGELGLIGEEGKDEVTGEIGHVIRAWAGINQDTGESYGVRTILAKNFVTYQQPGSDPSPPFAEYVSGHSTFSASAAEVLKRVTGSDWLGASVTIRKDASRFEKGTPHDEVTLSWDTFTQTAQESGMSRLFGNIHFMDGNTEGLALGHQIGANAFDLAQSYWTGQADDMIF